MILIYVAKAIFLCQSAVPGQNCKGVCVCVCVCVCKRKASTHLNPGNLSADKNKEQEMGRK